MSKKSTPSPLLEMTNTNGKRSATNHDRSNKKRRTVRVNLTLASGHSQEYSEFSYPTLLGYIEEAEAEMEEVNSPSSNDVPAFKNHYEKIAEQIEKKLDHVAYRAHGYDANDTFIDDNQHCDENIPNNVTFKYGGFYINSNEVEYRRLNDSITTQINELLSHYSDDEFVKVSKKKISKKLLKKKKKDKTAKEKTKSKPKSKDSKSNAEKVKRPRKVSDKPKEKLKKSPTKVKKEPVDKINPQTTLPKDLPMEIIEMVNQIVEIGGSLKDKENFEDSRAQEILNKLASKFRYSNVCRKMRENVCIYLKHHLPGCKKPVRSVIIKMMLNEIKDDLNARMNELKEEIDKCMESQQKNYDKMVSHSCQPPTKAETGDNKENSDDSDMNDHTEKELIDSNQLVFEVFQDNSSKSKEDQEKQDKKRLPRKSFQWNETLRQLLEKIVILKEEFTKLSSNRVSLSDNWLTELKLFFDKEVKTLWPKGWMNKGDVLREVKHLVHLPKSEKSKIGQGRKKKESSSKGGKSKQISKRWDSHSQATSSTPIKESSEGEVASPAKVPMFGNTPLI
ncbi:Ubinuclein-1 [Trichoplax sp. H2]|nr:Ubinuclein-1 [Trichoplax sp. H2]|eukprot:RDD38643.1 Ubinuclein-1 [Trichoplax sp. H2]